MFETRIANVFLVSLLMAGGLNIIWGGLRDRQAPFDEIGSTYGFAHDRFLAAQKVDQTHDRNWYLYSLVEYAYRGAVLVTSNIALAQFSRMYDLNFGGVRETRVSQFDPQLMNHEAEALRAMAIWQGRVTPVGDYVVIGPVVGKAISMVLLLTYQDTVFFVPVALAPPRFQELTWPK